MSSLPTKPLLSPTAAATARALAWVAFAALAAAIVWASLEANIWSDFGVVIGLPWGVVSLVDLYAGFLFAAVVMLALEPRRGLAIGLVLAMFVLGNLVPLVWLALRGLSALSRPAP